MEMVIKSCEGYLVNLDPPVISEIQKDTSLFRYFAR